MVNQKTWFPVESCPSVHFSAKWCLALTPIRTHPVVEHQLSFGRQWSTHPCREGERKRRFLAKRGNVCPKQKEFSSACQRLHMGCRPPHKQPDLPGKLHCSGFGQASSPSDQNNSAVPAAQLAPGRVARCFLAARCAQPAADGTCEHP